ncbi:hypothetical protein ASPBRDRAFT_40427 [Aspergillus brasiliensis CBS 101740]|uniref:Uncharacterized protein n=1 Tax=Aspergillus brasiliensis (strain CBS 101740 / IMI 381727 / IBT 21946) TaxID=767769 RepID=A0A1L9UU46_ASPBC|nr:hypothetical protein ASPBRDRAFT_40427 [Aspergillus brasiliensis CBS 101740]
MSSVSAFVTLPLLTLFSLPLALLACFTTVFSIIFLLLRFSVIYIELCLAIITNYFVIPTAANTSLLNFSASEPTTPAASTTPKRRSVDHSFNDGLLTALATYRPGYSLPRRTNSLTTTTSTSSTSQDTTTAPIYRKDEPPRNTPPRHSAPSALLTLISGDEGRDFEGLGGWRCATTAPPTVAAAATTATTTARYPTHHLLSDTASPSPNFTSNECDERAWLSINERLELPSQPLLSTRSNSNINNSEPLESLPWRHRRMASASPPPGGSSNNITRSPRHHHRSATTSLLSTSLSPKSSLPDAGPHDGLDYLQGRAISPPLSQQQNNTNTLFCTPSPNEKFPGVSIPRVSSPTDGSGGYFSFRPGSRSSTSGSTTPGEERRSPRPSSVKSMVHYPAGVRYRRRSMSGPNSGVKLTKASSGTERAL